MMVNFFSKLKNKKGFTLVELMVVVAIIGVLVAIAVPIYNTVTNDAKDNAIEANERIINGAIGLYTVDQQITTMSSINVTAAQTPSGTTYDALMKYIQEWPYGPDSVTYGVTNGKATHTP